MEAQTQNAPGAGGPGRWPGQPGMVGAAQYPAGSPGPYPGQQYPGQAPNPYPGQAANPHPGQPPQMVRVEDQNKKGKLPCMAAKVFAVFGVVLLIIWIVLFIIWIVVGEWSVHGAWYVPCKPGSIWEESEWQCVRAAKLEYCLDRYKDSFETKWDEELIRVKGMELNSSAEFGTNCLGCVTVKGEDLPTLVTDEEDAQRNWIENNSLSNHDFCPPESDGGKCHLFVGSLASKNEFISDSRVLQLNDEWVPGLNKWQSRYFVNYYKLYAGSEIDIGSTGETAWEKDELVICVKKVADDHREEQERKSKKEETDRNNQWIDLLSVLWTICFVASCVGCFLSSLRAGQFYPKPNNAF